MTDLRTVRLVLAWMIALPTMTACTFVLDKHGAQCVVNSDCDHFGMHPVCQEGVCVATGLGPEGCVLPPLSAQSDFANQCTTASWKQFNNCGRLGLCDSNAVATAISTSRTPPPTTPPPTRLDAAPT